MQACGDSHPELCQPGCCGRRARSPGWALPIPHYLVLCAFVHMYGAACVCTIQVCMRCMWVLRPELLSSCSFFFFSGAGDRTQGCPLVLFIHVCICVRLSGGQRSTSYAVVPHVLSTLLVLVIVGVCVCVCECVCVCVCVCPPA